ncbi:putative solute-binding protein [Aquabacterium sp.]|uniref:putative solute-binding protein n=1 Tax=Aquabacterium sp. TaxID=1872578 RepID=UPI002E370A10|nr:putative solute-binding protein [Aquabacterium sp.]HEX5313271.1 putative solute-binding protein [Aquabacterium sp.]
MKLVQSVGKTGAVALAILGATTQVQAGQKICVYDLLGTSGDIYNMAKDYALAMQKQGVSLDLKGYTDERVATEDFRTGQCDAVIATAFRTRQFNIVAGSIDTLGATTIVRDGKIDMPASYDVVRRVIQTYSAPQAGKLMVEGNYEVGGIVPLGAAYPVVNDRKFNTVEALAGKRIAAFDYDKAQAVMIQRIGAQPVSADITNFATKFNNGSVDMVGAPSMAYKPLELHKGIGKNGGIVRFPMLILTYQVMLNKTKFPEGFGGKSREYWAGQFDRAMQLIKQADASIPPSTWIELSSENSYKYTLMLRESRIDIAQQGLYDKRGLKVIKKIRCSVNPADPECATKSEEDWK